MAVRFTFAASKALKSVPCVGNSISLLELKDAIAAPLVAALKGKKLREQFDFRVYDADTKEEIVGASARVRKYASVLVKRVPAYVFDRSSASAVSTVRTASAVNPENVVIDDGFGEDVYSRSSVSAMSAVSAVSSDKVETTGQESRRSSKKEAANVFDSDFKEGVCSRSSAASVVSSEEVEKVRKEIRISREQEVETVGDIPKELMCTLCKHFMKDPMLIPCCCNSFCHNCIKVVLVGEKKCPNCESCRCSDMDLLPNRHLKSMIDAFFKSNPSVSSSGSCASRTTSSQVVVANPVFKSNPSVSSSGLCASQTTPSQVVAADAFFKSNPSVLSSGSCSSQTTSSQVVVADLQPETPHKNVSRHDIHVSNSAGSGSLGKRKPLIISLNSGSKRTKVL